MQKLAGTVVLFGGLCLIYLGGLAYDGGSLEGPVQRAIFFAIASVLVVAGFQRWHLRALPVALRVVSVLLIVAAFALAAGAAATLTAIGALATFCAFTSEPNRSATIATVPPA
jgi:uncharacterized membrane protein